MSWETLQPTWGPALRPPCFPDRWWKAVFITHRDGGRHNLGVPPAGIKTMRQGPGKWDSPWGGGYGDLSAEWYKWFLVTLQELNKGLGTSVTATAVQGVAIPEGVQKPCGCGTWWHGSVWAGQCWWNCGTLWSWRASPTWRILWFYELTPEFHVLLHLHGVSRSPSAAASCYECTPTTLAGHQTPSEWSKTGNTQRKTGTRLQFWACPLHKGSATAIQS